MAERNSIGVERRRPRGRDLRERRRRRAFRSSFQHRLRGCPLANSTNSRRSSRGRPRTANRAFRSSLQHWLRGCSPCRTAPTPGGLVGAGLERPTAPQGRSRRPLGDGTTGLDPRRRRRAFRSEGPRERSRTGVGRRRFGRPRAAQGRSRRPLGDRRACLGLLERKGLGEPAAQVPGCAPWARQGRKGCPRPTTPLGRAIRGR